MDDSINWYLHWAQGQIETWWAIAEPHLTSDGALRLYVMITAITVLSGSIYLAYRMMSDLRKIDLAEFSYRRRGRPPLSEEAIQRLHDRIRKFRARRWRFFLTRLGALIIFGFIIPSIGLYLCGAYYGWLDGGQRAFVTIRDGAVFSSTPQPTVLISFVLNQLSHGTLMDLFEVFDLDFSSITNNPNNYLFSLAVLLYRSFVGAFTVVLLLFIRRSMLVLWQLEPIEDQTSPRRVGANLAA